MITDAILRVLGGIMSILSDALPIGSLDSLAGLASDIGQKVGEYGGPANTFLPVYELTQFLVVFFGIWLPAAAVYVIAKWIYRHLPVLGKG